MSDKGRYTKRPISPWLTPMTYFAPYMAVVAFWTGFLMGPTKK